MEEYHSVYFKEYYLRIPLKSHGIFSYFPSSKPSNEVLNECDIILCLTPKAPWNPNTSDYSRNEDSVLYCKGEIIEKGERIRIMMSDL